jgi:hypothetical protein
LAAVISRRRHGVIVRLRATAGEQHHATVELRHGSRMVAARQLSVITANTQEQVLRVRGHLPPAGHYEVVVVKSGRRLAHRGVTVPGQRSPSSLTA